MKYYSEEKMGIVRLRLEEKILRWTKVTTKKMFGCPCYQANGNLFTFLVTDGIVLTRLSQTEREQLSPQYHATAFRASKKHVKNWAQIRVRNETDLALVMPLVEHSYRTASRLVEPDHR